MAAPANSGKVLAMWERARGFAHFSAAAFWLAGACADPALNDGGTPDGGDVDTDSDGDTDLDCTAYPEGPYDWDLAEVVSMEEFPAVYGTGGALTAFEMCRVFDEADEIKSVVFVIGTTTCPYCPARFTEIGEMDLAAYGAEKAAVYYNDQTANTNIDPVSTSEIADTYGWDDGWRISDTEDQVIFNGGYPDWLWTASPNVFVLDTHAMSIVAAEKGPTPTQLDVLAEVQAIDEQHP
jgi:hypothetical protein